MFTTLFWRAALERCIKAGAYSLGALLIGNGTGLLDTDWVAALSVAGMAVVLSVLGSIGSDALTGNGPSLTNAEVTAPR